MKVVNPNNAEHEFEFQPRFEPTDIITLYLKNEATNIELEVASASTDLKNELINIIFDFTFKERDKYQIRIMQDTEVVYRGKLFATEQETQDFVITEGYIKY